MTWHGTKNEWSWFESSKASLIKGIVWCIFYTIERSYFSRITFVCRLRHRQHVEECVAALNGYENVHNELDLASEELRFAAKSLGKITGSIDTDDILNAVFSEFCIGKWISMGNTWYNIYSGSLDSSYSVSHDMWFSFGWRKVPLNRRDPSYYLAGFGQKVYSSFAPRILGDLYSRYSLSILNWSNKLDQWTFALDIIEWLYCPEGAYLPKWKVKNRPEWPRKSNIPCLFGINQQQTHNERTIIDLELWHKVASYIYWAWYEQSYENLNEQTRYDPSLQSLGLKVPSLLPSFLIYSLYYKLCDLHKSPTAIRHACFFSRP